MKIGDKFIQQVIDGFQANKGKASLYCFNTDIIPKLIHNVFSRIYNKRGHVQMFVAVDKYSIRQDIMKYFINYREYDFKVITKDYIKDKYHYLYMITIIIDITDYDIIKKLSDESNFTLSIFTKNVMNNDFIMNVRNILPTINTIDLDKAIRREQIYSPVEETLINIALSNDNRLLYNKYTDYINQCMSIFGSLDTIEKCRVGDIANNISSIEFRNRLAKNNGWSYDLDMSIDFLKQIDDVYNPNNLLEKACDFYTFTKDRRNLITDSEDKLDTILKLCLKHDDKNIIIVSKRGEFAATVTKHLIKNGCTCGDYHDCIPTTTCLDDDNNIICYKTGPNKGKPKPFGYKAKSSFTEAKFNQGYINIISMKSASDNQIKVACDVIIFTSPLCGNIIDFKSRFSNIKFTNNIVYTIYCENTIEENNIKVTNPT